MDEAGGRLIKLNEMQFASAVFGRYQGVCLLFPHFCLFFTGCSFGMTMVDMAAVAHGLCAGLACHQFYAATVIVGAEEITITDLRTFTCALTIDLVG